MGIFGIKRKPVEQQEWEPTKSGSGMRRVGKKDEPVRKLRRKETLRSLKSKKKERKLERKLEKISRKTRLMESKAGYMEQKARRKKAQKRASFQWKPVPTPKIKLGKKRQGKPLTRKKRITLL